MKRTPLARRTPLTNRAPLHRATTSLARGARLRTVSRKRVGQQPQRRAVETALGRLPDGTGTCALCGKHAVVHGHELDPAGYGKDWSRPDCLLCDPCNDMVECAPIWAASRGWKRSTKHPRLSGLPVGAALRWDGTLHYFPERAA